MDAKERSMAFPSQSGPDLSQLKVRGVKGCALGLRVLWGLVAFWMLNIMQGWALAPVFGVNRYFEPDDTVITPISFTEFKIEISVGNWKLLALLPLYHAMFCVVVLTCTVCVKWIFLGRYESGRYELWGWYFCRCHLVEQLLGFADIAFAGWIESTPILCWWHRILGAHIGPNVSLGAVSIRHHDLIHIGEGACLEPQVIVAAGACLDGDNVTCAQTTIGANSLVCERAVLLPGCQLLPNSKVGIGQTIDRGKHLQPAGVSAEQTLVSLTEATCATSVGYVFGYCLQVGLFEACIFCGVYLLDWINVRMEYFGRDTLTFFPVFMLGTMISLSLSAILLKWLLLGVLRPGSEPLSCWLVWRYWMVHSFVKLNNGLTISLFSHSAVCGVYMRALGCGVDVQNTFVADLTKITAQMDLLDIGGNTFIAGDVSMPATTIDRVNQTVTFAATSVGKLCYVGHGSTVGPGCTVESMAVVGDMSVLTPGTKVPEMSMVLGQSRVITRPTSASAQAIDATSVPWWFHSLRVLATVYLLWIITACSITAFEAMFKITEDVGDLNGMGFFDLHKFFGPQPTQFCFVWRPLVGIIMLGVFAAVAIVHKWLFLNRVKVGSHHTAHDIDSVFFIIFGTCSSCWMLMVAAFRSFAGTPLASFMFNLMGARIGHNSAIFSMESLCDFDALTMGDGVYVGPNVFMQCHNFLNNGLGFGPITIGRNSEVLGLNSVFVSDTTMEHETTLGASSTIMRGEILPSQQTWQGNPAVWVRTLAHDDETKDDLSDKGVTLKLKPSDHPDSVEPMEPDE
eukprot:TRINITY_DN502_c0_g1_i1.p1 TRINITY_DN502_c0_g1~~TRINITY_DN502_c0_g1_i1.p1  ORF type:complete len:795 (-),score=153.76 TRINITY_DN502_c0_g1_i1:77-2461(-)